MYECVSVINHYITNVIVFKYSVTYFLFIFSPIHSGGVIKKLLYYYYYFYIDILNTANIIQIFVIPIYFKYIHKSFIKVSGKTYLYLLMIFIVLTLGIPLSNIYYIIHCK